MADVINIQPKKTTATYRHHRIVVEYVPEKGQWRWHFTHTQRMPFSNYASTSGDALKDARALIDRLEEGQT